MYQLVDKKSKTEYCVLKNDIISVRFKEVQGQCFILVVKVMENLG